MKESASAPTAKPSKLNFSLKSENASYDFTLFNKDDELTLKFEDLKDFPVKIYELRIQFEKLKQLDENFFMFKKLINLLMQSKIVLIITNIQSFLIKMKMR